MSEYEYRWVNESSGHGIHYSRNTSYTSPRREFKTRFILGYIFGICIIFPILGFGMTKTSDKEISAAQQRGLLLGFISNIAFWILFVVTLFMVKLLVPPYFLDYYIGAIVGGILALFFVSYVIGLVLFCKCYKT